MVFLLRAQEMLKQDQNIHVDREIKTVRSPYSGLILQLISYLAGGVLLQDRAVSTSDLITAHILCPSILAACWTASWKVRVHY